MTAESAVTSPSESAPIAAAPSTSPSTPASAPADAGTSEGGELTVQRVEQIALGAVAGGVVVEIGQGNEQGRSVWEVLVRESGGGGVELYIDAASGEILKQEPAQVPASANNANPTVSIQEAVDTAVSVVSGGSLMEIDLGEERGRTVWEVLVGAATGNTEFYIDGTTGEIVKQEAAD